MVEQLTSQITTGIDAFIPMIKSRKFPHSVIDTVHGLKDVARAWYKSVVGHVQELGRISSSLDPTIFSGKMETV